MRAVFLALLPAMICAQVPGSSRLLYNRYGQSDAFTGIGQLRAGSTCTGSFIRPHSGAVSDGAPAYILTNGHCIGLLRTNEVIINSPQRGYVQFGQFADIQESQERFNIKQTAFATMKGTDLAIFELDATYGQLTARGYRPLEIQAEPLSPGEPVIAVGVPVTGIALDEQYLRQADCRVSGQTQLIEFTWTWYEFLRTDCADIKPGSSGSPLISTRTRKLVGLINTTTQDAAYIGPGFACYLGVPCEIRPEGPTTIRDAAYATPVAGVERCFASGGALDLNLTGCPLDQGRQLTLSGFPNRTTRPMVDGRPVTWNTTISGKDFTHYRYKIVQEGSGDCRSARGYGPVISLSAANKIDGPLPEGEVGTYLCVQGGNGPVVESSWQDLRHATFAHVRIDTSSSTVPPVVLLHDDGDVYRVDFRFVVPELSNYSYKFGPPAATDCKDPRGYASYRRFPFTIPKSEPVRFCAYGEDNAGNTTAPHEQLLDGIQILKDGVVNAASYGTGPLSPGVLASLFGVNFTPRQMSVTVADAGGSQRSATVLYAGTDQVNFLVPPETALGAATITISHAGASASATASIDAASPGVFAADAFAGAPLAYVKRTRPDGSSSHEPAFRCPGAGQCLMAPVYLSVGDRVNVEVYLTGMRIASADVRISGLSVPVVSVGPADAAEGVDRVEFQIPYSIPVRGYVPLTITAGGNTSRTAYLWLK